MDTVGVTKSPLPTLRVAGTAGLCLRAYRATDAPRLARLAGVQSVVQFTLGIPLPYSEDAAAEWIAGLEERFSEGIEVIYALSLRGQLIGSIGLTLDAAGHDRNADAAEVGYWLGEPYRGRGLMRAALTRLCGQLFKKAQLRRVYALCFPDNRASHAVLRASGFQLESHLHQHVYKNGLARDVLLFGLAAPPVRSVG